MVQTRRNSVALLWLNLLFYLKKKKSLQLHFNRLQFSGRGRQDQVPEQDGSADHLQRHAGQRLPEEEVNAAPATSRNWRVPPPSSRGTFSVFWEETRRFLFKCRWNSNVVDSLNRNEGCCWQFFILEFLCERMSSIYRRATVFLRLAARKHFHGLGRKRRDRGRRHWTVFRFTKKWERTMSFLDLKCIRINLVRVQYLFEKSSTRLNLLVWCRILEESVARRLTFRCQTVVSTRNKMAASLVKNADRGVPAQLERIAYLKLWSVLPLRHQSFVLIASIL